MAKKPFTGVLKDPWRSAPKGPPPSKVKKPTASEADSPLNDDMRDAQYAHIELRGYGGITVDGVSESRHAAAQLLKVCVDFHKQIDPILVRYGVLITQLPVTELNTKFYVQRADGWLLAVPEAQSLDEGRLQLIQAMMAINQDPELRKHLRRYHLRPYKM